MTTTPIPPPNDPDALDAAILAMGANARRVQREIDDATATPTFMSYHLAPEWFEGVDAAIEHVNALVARQPAAALLLAEHAIRRLEHADLDDSDGWLAQAFPRLELIHAAACDLAGVRSAQLAERLRALASASDIEAFYDAPNTHKAALGDAGINRLLRAQR